MRHAARPVQTNEATVFVRSPFRVAAIASLASAALLAVGGALLWIHLHSTAARARGHVEQVMARRRCYLIGLDRNPHIDPATGLLVVDDCYGQRHDQEYDEAWNGALRERLAAGEACEPRWTDRITTPDAVRKRFRYAADRVVSVIRDREQTIGGQTVLFTDDEIRVGEDALAEYACDEHGRCPPSRWGPFKDFVATALVSEDGRTIYVRVADATGRDRHWFVFDLGSGTLLYRFLDGS